jgi:hypothetical protein
MTVCVDVHSQEATEDLVNVKAWDFQITVKESNANIKGTITMNDNLLFHPAEVWGDDEKQVDVIRYLEVGDKVTLEFKDFNALATIVKLDASHAEITIKGEFLVPTPDDGSRSYHKWHPLRQGTDVLLDLGADNRAIDYELEKSLIGGTRVRIRELFEGLRPGLMDMILKEPDGNRRGVSFIAEELHVAESSAEVLLRPLVELKGDS